MANVGKYNNQTIIVNGNEERLSTNGYYTGQHKGSVMQDANEASGNQPYEVENGTIRYGTIMGDAADGSMPTVPVAAG